MTSKAIVVAHFREDLSWLADLSDEWIVWLYHKSPDHATAPPGGREPQSKPMLLPNIGREAHTYLYHIVQHYDDLKGEIVFCQGNPFPHDRKFIHHLACDEVRWYGRICECDIHGNPHWVGAKFLASEYCRVFGLPIPDSYRFVSGAQYRLHAEQIKKRPRKFYETLLAVSEIQRDHPWNLERLWPIIWNVPLASKAMADVQRCPSNHPAAL
ncbi:MAG: DUF3431 domain-containing protein [Chthoniobacter sp.]|uniref:DUF3431 domain-containing protein n=1 Tax=Chthoniobacter sp. TaxID=2510640 RepID=UPI0032A92965